MRIMVNGTWEELRAIDRNGTEWTNDLLGNYDALHYDKDLDEYTMTQEEFKWWVPVVDMLNEIEELEPELDDDEKEEYQAECFGYSDFDDEVRVRLNWLKEHVK